MIEIDNLFSKYNLGNIKGEPELVTGGLLHKMYHVSTDKGDYAIKLLNPDIMKRADALTNMINSELVSNALVDVIKLIAAKSFNGNSIIDVDGTYFVVFDWLDGKSIFAPDILKQHCEQIGRALGLIHSAHIKIDSLKMNHNIRKMYDWNIFVDSAKKSNSKIYTLLVDNLADIMNWDENAVCGLQEASDIQVVSHRDLDPKNVMWQNDIPFIIDWEAAGYVNPYQELIEVLNYWIQNKAGGYDKEKFIALMSAYTEYNDISGVNWQVILNCSFDGMLGWLEYNVKRALCLEGTGANDKQEGISQSIGTVDELKKYENQMRQLKEWIDEYVRNKYTL